MPRWAPIAVFLLVAGILLEQGGWPSAAATEDTLTWWSGEATAVSSGVAGRVYDGMPVRAGDEVRTAVGGRVTITFRDGSLLSLEPGTAVRIGRSGVEGDRAHIEVVQEAGHSWSSLPANGYRREYVVRTPTSTASARGTAFEIEVAAAGATVTTAEGTVDLRAGELTAEVSAGMRGQAANGSVSASGAEARRRMVRFSAPGGSSLLVTDPHGRSCGAAFSIGVVQQIPGCIASATTDPVLVDIRDAAWSGAYVVSVMPPAGTVGRVSVVTVTDGVVTSVGSASATAGGLVGSRVVFDVSEGSIDAAAMSALVAMAVTPLRLPAVASLALAVTLQVRAGSFSAPDPALFMALSEPLMPDRGPDPSVAPPAPLASPPLAAVITEPPSTTPAPPASDPSAAPPTPGPSVAPSTPVPSVALPTPGPSLAPPTPSAPIGSITVPATPSPVPSPAPDGATPVPSPQGVLTMTNVAGLAAAGANCDEPTAAATCATLFASDGLRPGGGELSNTVTIRYSGSAPARIRIHATGLVSPAIGSSALCTAPDPAAGIALRIAAGDLVLYPPPGQPGDLSDFAARHGSAAAGLLLAGPRGDDPWHDGDEVTFRLSVHLAAGSGNAYQGCTTSVDLVWQASGD